MASSIERWIINGSLPVLLAVLMLGLFTESSITGMVESDGSYISPTSDGSYKSPTSDGSYKSPTSDESYKSPTSDNSYISPKSDSSYISPTSDDSYKSPTSDTNYSSPTSDGNYNAPTADDSYKSPTGDESYKAPASDESYKIPTSDENYKAPLSNGNYKSSASDQNFTSPASGAGLEKIESDDKYESPRSEEDYTSPKAGEGLTNATTGGWTKVIEWVTGIFKAPKEDSSYKRPKSDSGAKLCTADKDCKPFDEKCLNKLCVINAKTGKDSLCPEGQHHYDPYGDGKGFCAECFSSSECPNNGAIFCENGYDAYFTCADKSCRKWVKDKKCADYKTPVTDNYSSPQKENIEFKLNILSQKNYEGKVTASGNTVFECKDSEVTEDDIKLVNEQNRFRKVDYYDEYNNPVSITMQNTYNKLNQLSGSNKNTKTDRADGSSLNEKVTNKYKYDPDGRLSSANGAGTIKTDDGFGNIAEGNIKQSYSIINNGAKLSSTITSTDLRNLDGSIEKQEITVTYSYDGNGNLAGADGAAILKGDDGFGNIADGKMKQTYAIINNQAKISSTVTESTKTNLDGSTKNQKITVAYTYAGKLTGASGSGTFKVDDGFGNTKTGTISLSYSIINGRPKLVSSKIDYNEDSTSGDIIDKGEITIIYKYDENGKLLESTSTGSSASDDGFGNRAEGKIEQEYSTVSGQAKLIVSKNSNTEERDIEVEGRRSGRVRGGARDYTNQEDDNKINSNELILWSDLFWDSIIDYSPQITNKEDLIKQICIANVAKDVQLTTIPKVNSDFLGWSGECSGANPNCKIKTVDDKIVYAVFAAKLYSPMQAKPTFEPKKGIISSAFEWVGNLFTKKGDKGVKYRNQQIVSHEATQDYPAACEDYPTMPGCPGEGTNIAIPMPKIPEVNFTGFEPRKAYPGTPVYLKGKNLGYVSKIYFNGELVEGFSILSNGDELETIVPQGAQTGEIALVLTSGGAEYSDQDFIVWTGVCSNPEVTKAFKQLNKFPQGQKNEDECDVKKYGAYSNYKELRNAIQKVVGFNKLPAPKINYFNPSIVLPGQEVSIIGFSFDIYADDIQFDGKPISFRLIDDIEAKVKIPQDALFGEHEIKIISDIHGSGSAKIKIVPLPGITDFNPKNIFSNDEITISGENFYETEEISFYETTTKKDTITKNFRKESLQQIKVNAPQNPGSYIITVKAKNSYARAQTSLTVAERSLPPQITSIEPVDNSLGGNAIIHGSNLKGIISITLNGYRMRYHDDPSGNSIKIYAVLDDPLRWGIHQGVVKVKTAGGEAQAELLSNKNPVTKLVTGKEEICFGGVGKGCYGSEDGKEEWGWGSQKIVAPVGCSKEVNGQRNCWSVPGSIKHDNCCARFPSGKMCGGPGKDGKPAGDDNHDGKCVAEWDAAFWDVFWWRAFVVTFDVTKPTDLTPKSSSRYTLKDDEGNVIPSETAETLRFCAPAGHELREQYDEGFCCSGKAVNKKCTAARGVLAISRDDGVTRTEQGADLSTVPIPLAPGETAKVVEDSQAQKSYLVNITRIGSGKGGLFIYPNKPAQRNLCEDDGCTDAKMYWLERTRFELKAVPSEGSVFAGWEGACEDKTKDICIFIMPSKHENLVAKFEAKKPLTPTFELEIEGAYSGNVKTEDGKITNCRNQNVCKATYPKNTKVTVIATPDFADYENSGWFGDCVNVPKTEPCILTMDSNKKVRVGFFAVTKPTPPPEQKPKPTNQTKRWWQKPICVTGRYCIRPLFG